MNLTSIKRHFSPKIWDSGIEYYLDGKVGDIIHSGDKYSAVVMGSNVYLVKIEVNQQHGGIESMECSCPYARKGNRCKHMAAVLYKLSLSDDADLFLDGTEDEEEEGEQEYEGVPDFKNEYLPAIREKFSKSYYFYDFPAMMEEMQIDRDVWAEGWNMAQEGRIVLTQFSEYQFASRSLFITGDFIGPKGGRKGWLQARLERKHISYLECRVDECDYGQWTCPHEAAFLIMIGRFILENNPGDITTDRSEDLISALAGRHMVRSEQEEMQDEAIVDKEKLRIKPRLKYKNEQLVMMFWMGSRKLYKIRSLDDFIETAEEGGEIKQGSSGSVTVKPSAFHGINKDYYDLISGYVHQQRAVDRYREEKAPGSFNATSLGDAVVLNGETLDRAYDLAENGGVEFEDDDKKKTLLHTREASIVPRLEIREIRNEDDELDGISLSGDLPQLKRGSRASYYIDGSSFCRVEKSSYDRFKPLLDASNAGMIYLQFGRKHISSFYYDVLPELEEFCDITDESGSEWNDIVADEVELTFYLDSSDVGITCILKARAGDREEEQIVGGGGTVNVTDDPTLIQIYRDDHNEDRLIRAADLLSESFDYFDEETCTYQMDNDEDEIFDLMTSGISKMKQYGDVQGTDAFGRISFHQPASLSMGVRIDSGLLDLKISSEGIPDEELADVLKDYRLRKRFHRLKSGNFVALQTDDMDTLDQIMQSLDMSPDEISRSGGDIKVPAYRTMYVDRLLGDKGSMHVNKAKSFRQMVRDFKTIDESEFELPDDFRGTLRPYQEEGFRWIMTLHSYGLGGILADDMGLGKTVQVAAALCGLKNNRSLIVAPASLIYNWQSELARFAPSLRVLMSAGTRNERREALNDYELYDVILTSYDLLKRDIDLFRGIEFDCQIIDEAQYIKNSGTGAAKSVKSINSRFRLALTGTPIENRLSELWSIFDYLMPGFLYSYRKFRDRFEKPIVKAKDEEAHDELKRMISPFVLRRTKSEVLKDLPDKLENVYYSVMESEQQKLYDAQVAALRLTLRGQNDEEFRKNRMAVLAALTRIREICCEPSIVYEDYNGGSAKREACMELVESAIEGGHKILLFSQFTTMLGILAKDLEKRKIPYYEIIGSTPKQKRVEMVNRFNRNDIPVFLISLKAGGFGLNLTGADTVIHYDPWWNAAVQNQATDRAYRIGQDKVVNVYDMIIKGSIEEKIIEMQRSKAELADDMLSGSSMSAGTIDRDELLEIL